MNDILVFILFLLIVKLTIKPSIENMADLNSEAIQNISSVYNNNHLTATNITSTGLLQANTATLNGVVNAGGTLVADSMNVNNNLKINGTTQLGNSHIQGNLSVDGTTNINQPLIIQGVNILDAIRDLQNNAIRKDKMYALQSSRGGYLIDKGGWSSNFPTKTNCWEGMWFRDTNVVNNGPGRQPGTC